MVSPPTVPVLRGVVTTFHALAIISTVFRLIYRTRARRLGLDDLFAGFSLCFLFVCLVCIWVRTDAPGVGPLNQPHRARLIAYWMLTFDFTCSLWSARLSIIFSIMRVMPPMMTIRRVTQWFSVSFVLMWMALIVQKAVHCTSDLSWQKQAKPQCHLGRAIGITELSADFVSDVVLVILPLRLMWNLQLPTRQRRLLISLFSASMIITLISIVHAVFVIGPAGFLEAMSANIQIAVSLMVCNLAVVVRFFYRFFGYDASDDVPVFVTSDTIPGTSGGPGRRGAPIRLGNLRNDARVSTLRFWNDTNVDDAGMTQSTQSKTHSHLDSPGYREERRDFERLELSFTPTKLASLEVPMDGQHLSGPITRATFAASPTEPQAR